MELKLISDKLEVEINAYGAEVISVKDKAGIEYIWQAKKEIWPRHAPILFPIVGKLKDNSYLFNQSSYQLSQHGFARDQEFTLLEKTNSSLCLQLKSNHQTKKKYPFDFTLQVKYSLHHEILTTQYKVINPSIDTMYFSIGGHPGFNCPLRENEKFEDYYLQFESSEYLVSSLTDGLRSGNKVPLNLQDGKLFLSKTLFDSDALVFENTQIQKITLCSLLSNHKIEITCTDWPYFGIWSKKGSTEFICLEPWHGITDAENTNQHLTKKEGIIELLGKNEFISNFSLRFHS